jgi:3-oxoacyl-[acyl-carrier protein] reductase
MPGFTVTERVQKRVPGSRLDQVAAQSPLGRLPTASDVAPSVVFLASAANTIVSGEIIRASGGIT